MTAVEGGRTFAAGMRPAHVRERCSSATHQGRGIRTPSGGDEQVPLILDKNDDVLSFPPIINGDHTTVTHTTRDFFVDVTGWDERACEAALMLVCLQLAQQGGTVESVEITTGTAVPSRHQTALEKHMLCRKNSWKTCWGGPSPMKRFTPRFNAWAADLKAGNPHPRMHPLSPRQWQSPVREPTS